jgi:hypothetical protein
VNDHDDSLGWGWYLAFGAALLVLVAFGLGWIP